MNPSPSNGSIAPNPTARGSLQRSDTLPAEDPTWRLSKPTAGGTPIPPRNEPILYVRKPRRHSGSEAIVEEE
jgi:hypothetical protein